MKYDRGIWKWRGINRERDRGRERDTGRGGETDTCRDQERNIDYWDRSRYLFLTKFEINIIISIWI